ncbi:hypothetical protein [Hymenobacter crusticola]|uniref:DUF481 domain-containing protein n=1 Tax=Hymenobacter crusticola TaxID=1770526 RepID=A0A243W6Z2_9BACT|nr:hypothetical protein [Hymenobacter crusticola]OUJ70373.1 hypothetical protein BXP70_24360 [Hymenobacter crusticola]
MKTFLASVAAVAWLTPARAQSLQPERRHELWAGGGPLERVMLDRQASPLVYRAKGSAFQLTYTRRGTRSRLSLDLQPTFGQDLAKRYGVRRYHNGVGTYAIQSAYYDASLALRYLRRLPTANPAKLRLFAGLGVQNRLQVSDAVANLYWGLNVAGLYAEGRAEYQPTPAQQLTAELSVPGLAAVTRHTYANYPKSTDESNLGAFFTQGTQWASLDQFQQVQASLRYHYTLFRRLHVGVRYRFQWLHYPAPRPIRAYDQSLLGQLGYQF